MKNVEFYVKRMITTVSLTWPKKGGKKNKQTKKVSSLRGPRDIHPGPIFVVWSSLFRKEDVVDLGGDHLDGVLPQGERDGGHGGHRDGQEHDGCDERHGRGDTLPKRQLDRRNGQHGVRVFARLVVDLLREAQTSQSLRDDL